MPTIPFTPNKNFSIGVEIEFQLLCPKTFDLSPKGPELLEKVPAHLRNNFKAEFIQSMVEIVTNKCENMNEVADNLNLLSTNLDTFCDWSNCLPYSSSLHPFASIEQRKLSDNKRYHQIMNDLQIVGKRLITQGLHIHIGLKDADTAIAVNNSIRAFLPLLLAITASSPFYNDQDTGFQSFRSKLFESLPRSGLPSYLTGWKQFEGLIQLLTQSGTINSVKEIWWDVRPHTEFGTIEIRVCDLPSRLNTILAITALMQALVAKLSQTSLNDDTDFNILLNNKWQAARYGTTAQFIDANSGNTQSVKEAYDDLLNFIEPQLLEFRTLPYLSALTDIFRSGNPAEQYRNLYTKNKSHSKSLKKIQGEFLK